MLNSNCRRKRRIGMRGVFTLTLCFAALSLNGCSQAELESAQRTIKKQETQQKKMKRKLETAKKLTAEYDAQIKQWESRYSELEFELKDAAIQMKAVKKEQSEVSKAKDTAQKRVELLSDQLQAKENEATKLEQKIDKAKDQKNQYRSKYMILKGRFNKLKKKVTESKDAIAKEKEKYKQLSTEKKKLAAELLAVQTELENAAGQADPALLEKQVSEAVALVREECEAKAIKNDVLSKKIEELENNLDHIALECDGAIQTSISNGLLPLEIEQSLEQESSEIDAAASVELTDKDAVPE